MVRLIDIKKEYENGTEALCGVTMRIDDGEFAFLVGPSGSGKSTLINQITAEVAPSEGRIMVNGHVAKAGHELKLGDIIDIAMGSRRLKIKVAELKETVRANEADTLYEILEDVRIQPERTEDLL